MRSNVLAGINSCFNYELQRFGAAFIRQNWDALISLMTHVVWKWAKTRPSRTLPLKRGDLYNAIDFLDPKNRVIAALDCIRFIMSLGLMKVILLIYPAKCISLMKHWWQYMAYCNIVLAMERLESCTKSPSCSSPARLIPLSTNLQCKFAIIDSCQQQW